MDSLVCQNSKAHYQYEILETLEVGIVLKGCEIKSIRTQSVSLSECWIQIDAGELWLKGLYIPPYTQGSFGMPDPRRARKLLAKTKQRLHFQHQVERKGVTIVPLKLYFVKNKLKVFMGLARGKTHADKREDLKEKEDKRSMARAMKGK
jgi:SsrA-binding protein